MKTSTSLPSPVRRINLCSGTIHLPGYWNVDIDRNADLVLDLEHDLLPFPDDSVDLLVCISAINYFTRERAQAIIQDVFRVLKPGGLTRFGTQDLRILAKHYLQHHEPFWGQKLANGQDRFPGKTFADKFNAFFYGFTTAGGKTCKYVYDFDSLTVLFEEAGFSQITEKQYLQSQIPNIEQIDNRPEQMFFLEAVKPSPLSASTYTSLSFKDTALNLWQAGQLQKAWQYFLKALEETPGDRPLVVKCGEILVSLKRFEDASRLYENYLRVQPTDEEIKRLVIELTKQKQMVAPPPTMLPSYLPSLERQARTIHSDEIHLKGCLTWLERAQAVTGNGGVSATYNLTKQEWGVSYPETTGYIIPTFLAYFQLTKEARYRQAAILMGDFEIEIQWPEGGVGEPLGVYGQKPRVFNTSQVMLGWLALYRHTGEEKYLAAAERAGQWIVSQQDADGKWTRSTYNGPKSYKSRVAWSLLELFAITQQDTYRLAAERAIDWILKQAHPNGWFANQNLLVPEPWTHLIGYTLQGLLEIYLLENTRCDRPKLLNLLHQAAQNIVRFYQGLRQQPDRETKYLGLPGTFDARWSSQDNWSCVTGNAQIAFFLRKLAKTTQLPLETIQVLPINSPLASFWQGLMKQLGNAEWLQAADELVTDLKKVHWLDGIEDANLYGAVAGSHPLNGPYATYLIPNWGVKFFADALLQRLLPEGEQQYLG